MVFPFIKKNSSALFILKRNDPSYSIETIKDFFLKGLKIDGQDNKQKTTWIYWFFFLTLDIFYTCSTQKLILT